jgi:hypothetical protein
MDIQSKINEYRGCLYRAAESYSVIFVVQERGCEERCNETGRRQKES